MAKKTETDLNLSHIMEGAAEMAKAKVDAVSPPATPSKVLELALNSLLDAMQVFCYNRCKNYDHGRCSDQIIPPCALATIMGGIPAKIREGLIKRILSFDKTIKPK